MGRYTASNCYLEKGYGICPATGEEGVRNPSIYIQTFRTKRQAEDAADALNGDDWYARHRPAPRVKPEPRPRDRNAYAASCHECGEYVPRGAGWLYRYSGANSRGMSRSRYAHSEYIAKVRCEKCGESTRN